MLQEFKDFINRGNVLDLAVAVVLGVAFGAVITSFIDNVLMQIVAAVVGEPNFSSLTFEVSDTSVFYGSFLTEAISFVSVAGAVFMVVRAYNAARGGPDEPADSDPSEIDLLTEIRDALQSR